MTKLWILVADAGRARIFLKPEETHNLTLVQELDNPQGRLHTHDLVSDHRGQAEKGGTGVMSAMQPHTDPHEEKAVEFAMKLGHLLEKAAERGDYDRVSLVAPPHFLGLLRAHLGAAAKHRLDRCAAKDLSHFSGHEIARHLHETLQQACAT
jgi:protein required for attachment to host cells